MNRISKQFKRDIKAFLITFILYMPLLFWWQYSNLGVSTPLSPTPLVLNIQDFHTKEEVILEEPMLEDDFFEDLEEIMKEVIAPEPIPALIPQPLTNKPKPLVEKKVIKKRVKKRKIITKKRLTTKRKVTKKISSRQKSSKGDKSKFLSRLKRKIDSNKIYPRMAKKRGLEGSVRVSFTITSLGGVSNINIKGSKIFIKATKRAINRSFPVNIKGIFLPITLNLTLKYRLKRK